MARPRLVQCLCPVRHCIVALAYEPGMTAAQADFGSCDDITLTADNAEEYVRGMVEGMIKQGALNPICGLCGAKRDRWFFEDRQLAFETLAEALVALRAAEEAQRALADYVKAKRN